MAKKKVIVIDTSLWITQSEYARLKGVTIQVVNNWTRRDKLPIWHIPELNLTLVKR